MVLSSRGLDNVVLAILSSGSGMPWLKSCHTYHFIGWFWHLGVHIMSYLPFYRVVLACRGSDRVVLTILSGGSGMPWFKSCRTHHFSRWFWHAVVPIYTYHFIRWFWHVVFRIVPYFTILSGGSGMSCFRLCRTYHLSGWFWHAVVQIVDSYVG